MRDKIRRILEKRTIEITVLTVILVLAGAFVQASDSGILDSGNSNDLVAEYRFDTGAGDTAYDTARSNDGVLSSPDWTNGVEGNGLHFNSNKDDIVTHDDISFSDGESHTYSTWVKWEGGDTSRYILPFGDRGDTGSTIYFTGNGGTSEPQFIYRDSNGNTHTILNNHDWFDGKWHHIVWTTDTNRNTKVYRDGKLLGTSTISDNSITYNAIGRGYGNTDYDWEGKIDQTEIYSESLNKSQIRSLYNSGSWQISAATKKNDPSKILDINFQIQNSTHILDLSGEENHGKSRNGASQENAVNCKVGRCYEFDGNDDYMAISNYHYESDTLSNFTVSSWIKANSDGIIASFDRNEYWRFEIGGNAATSGHVGMSFDGDGGQVDGFDSSTQVTDGKWHHVAFTFNQGETKLFVDGRQENSINSGSVIGTGGIRYGFIGVGSEAETFDGSKGPESHFDGEIDQFKIYNKSLSKREIIEKTKGLSSNGAVLEMRFNEEGGDHIEDYSGNNNHGELSPNETAGPERVEGLTGQALKFDGVDDTVPLDSKENLALNTTDGFVLSSWIKRSSISGRDEMVMSHKGTDRIRFEIRDGETGMVYYSNSDDDWTSTWVSTSVDDDEWHKVDWRVENDILSVYFDGKKQGEADLTYSLPNVDGSVHLGIGRGSAEYYSGKIDNLKLYNHVLPPEMLKDYQRPLNNPDSRNNSLEDGLIISQGFDRIEECGQSDTVSCPSGMSGNVSVDNSGEANHGKVTSNAVLQNSDKCRVGRCLKFRGKNSGANVDLGKKINPSETTISAWVKPKDTGYSYNYIYSNSRDCCGDYKGVDFRLRTGNLYFKIWNGSNTETLSSSETFDPNEWMHVTASFDGENLRLYEDGELVASKSTSVDIGDPSTYNSYIGAMGHGPDKFVFNGSIDQVKIYNRSLSKENIWKLYAQGRDRSFSGGMAGPIAHYPLQREGSPVVDVSGEGNHGDLDIYGETGTFNSSNGEWRTVRFNRTYEEPVVVGTTNTHNGESALSFDSRNVQGHKAEMRLCESEGGSEGGCDAHGTERAGYMVVDANSLDNLSGVEAGTFSIDSDFDSKTKTVSYSESFSNPPYVMANVQTANGKQPVEARVEAYSASDFTAGICYQDSTDSCDGGHETEKIGWIALEPGNLNFVENAEVGSTGDSVSSSDWTHQSFQNEYDNPVVGVSTISNDGGEDSLVDEARKLNGSKVEVRYCEVETGDICDGHTSEEVAWFAAEKGFLTNNSGNSPRYVEDEDKGKVLELDGTDDYIQTPVSGDTAGSAYTVTAWFYANSIGQNTIVGNYDGSGILARLESGDDYDLWHNSGSIEGGDVTLNKWTHVAYVYDGSKGYIYENGDLVASGSLGDGSHSNDLRIGDSYDDRQFDGKLDDVRIYPYALNDKQVKKVMNSGSTSIG